MLSRVLESATIFTAVHIDLTGIPKDHHWDIIFPTVLWVSMLSCLTYFTNHQQTTHHIPLRSSTYMLSTGSPQGCVLPKSWGLTTLQSAALFFVSKHNSHAEGAAATPLPHTQKEQSGAETADVLLLHHHLESTGILHHCLGCCLHSS